VKLKLYFLIFILLNSFLIFPQDKFEGIIKIAPDNFISIENLNGNIEVDSWNMDFVQITALKVSWSSETKNELHKVSIIGTPIEGGILIKTIYDASIQPDRISVFLNIKLPSSTPIKDISTMNGFITTNRTLGSSQIISHSGDIRVNNHTGNLMIVTYNGGVRCENILGDLNISTIGGRIKLDNVEGTVNTYNNNLWTTADNVTGKINLSSESGYIKATQCEGEINLSTSIGWIKVENSKGLIEAYTGFGRVSITDSSGEIRVKNGNGSISIVNSGDIIYAETNRGNIDAEVITINESGTTLKTANGNIKASISKMIDSTIKISGNLSKADLKKTSIKFEQINYTMIKGVTGKGTHNLLISTGSGKIKIEDY